jgi:type II secretory pathway pseudopilin PulG
MKLSRITPHAARVPHHAAFTMIEIALSLAIIGFALVAIIGVLPTGLNVQKENREETIINQDASVWMEAIRNGAKGYEELTNYVLSISIYSRPFNVTPTATNPAGANVHFEYTPETSTRDGTPTNPILPLTDATNIVGLLTTPKYRFTQTGFFSNHVVLETRAISGAAPEKFPQDNPDVRLDAFRYRMISDVQHYVAFDPLTADTVNTNNLSAEQIAARFQQQKIISNLQRNSRDLRLTFRWPVLPNDSVGQGRQTFRTLVGGQLMHSNRLGHDLFFIQPSTYVRADQ